MYFCPEIVVFYLSRFSELKAIKNSNTFDKHEYNSLQILSNILKKNVLNWSVFGNLCTGLSALHVQNS